MVVDHCVKMEIKNKETGISIKCNLDYKSYKRFLHDVKQLGQLYESKSKINNLKYSIILSAIKTPYMETKGWCSRVIDKDTGRVSEVLFLDYDNILYYILKEELRYLIEKYDLPPIYVFKTQEETDKQNNLQFGNYICICLKKCQFKQITSIHEETHSDRAHQIVPRSNKWATWVLRLGSKGKKGAPEFKEVIGDINKEYSQEISNAHLEGLYQLYPNIPRIKYTNKDKGTVESLFLNTYLTASK